MLSVKVSNRPFSLIKPSSHHFPYPWALGSFPPSSLARHLYTPRIYLFASPPFRYTILEFFLSEELRLISSTEGIDVTAKALMHRITKLKATQAEPGEPGKASPVKSAKRSADGKPKGVIPDPEDEDADANGDGDNNDVRSFFPFRTLLLHAKHHRPSPPSQKRRNPVLSKQRFLLLLPRVGKAPRARNRLRRRRATTTMRTMWWLVLLQSKKMPSNLPSPSSITD